MADRSYEKQIIRFGNRGLNLSVPSELVPQDQYVRLNEVVSYRDGTLQSGTGGVVLFTSANTHTIRRFSRHSDGTTFFVVGTGVDIKLATSGGGFYLTVISTMSGNPMTFLLYKVALTSAPYMYVGDISQSIKIDVNGVATRIGIVRPLVSLGQIAVVPTSAGAGNLTGDYDWRYTYYNSVTGAESNPSDVGTTITLAAENANVPVVQGVATNGDMDKIRVYRRGGTLPDAWRLVDTIANATATYVDSSSDTAIASARIMALDNDIMGTSVTQAGVTLADLSAVPLPYIWGSLEETLFACGDPNRPDTVYYSKQGMPESWPAENTIPIETPQDRVVNGFIYDNMAFAFTQKELYGLVPNIVAGDVWTPVKTPCGHGAVGPFAFCVGPKVWFCSKDGIYEWSNSGPAERISDFIRPLFPYTDREAFTQESLPTNYFPVAYGFNLGIENITTVRMTYHNNEVWLFYLDVFGNRQTFAYSTEKKAWRACSINQFLLAYSDEGNESNLLQVDLTGNTIQAFGVSRAGAALDCLVETGGHDQGFPRADKEYGDGAVWADCDGNTITIQVLINSNRGAPVLTTTLTGSGLQRYILPLAGLYGRHISYVFSWQSDDNNQPRLYWIETAYLPHPEEIIARKTDWDDLGHPADKLVKGVLLTADLRGNPVTIQVLYDNNAVGATFTIGPTNAGQVRTFNVGFPSFRARRVRLVPTSAVEWKFYGINRWLFDAEPECLTWHEVYWGDAGHAHDKLIKGITIEADCGGVERTLRVLDDTGTVQQIITIGPGVAGIPAIYERSWSSFRSRNVRLLEGV